jgi:hypothetical protein
MLPIYIRIRSEYFERDSSIYRLAITQNTLLPSLKNQTDKDFCVSLSQSPMDPRWTSRKAAIEAVCHLYDSDQAEQRIEVEVGDDDFLCPTFIESLRKIPFQKENSFLSLPNGYIFHEGKLRVWRSKENIASATMFVDDSPHIGRTIEACLEPSWIYVRHQMNSSLIPVQHIVGPQVSGLSWKGWKESLVAKYCKTEVKQATSNGSKLEPGRSKKAFLANGAGGARRR